MIRAAVALSAVACITSLTALVNERQVRPPLATCEYRLARLTVQPVEMKGTLVDEALVNFDERTE